MKGRLVLLLLLIAMGGCIKEYDMDKLSKKAHFSPAIGISAVKGTISLKDIVEPNDTIIFDENDFVKIVIREDNIIDFRISDYYDLNDIVSFDETYTIGEMKLDSFTETLTFSVNQISSEFTPPVTFTTGTYPGFPSFPAIDIEEQNYAPFPNFDNATFSEGTLEIAVRNNLPVTLGGLTIKLFNTSGHTQIGDDIIISSVSQGGTGFGYLNLANQTITNSITAAVQIHATAGTGSPVVINLNTTNIEIAVTGQNMKVRSGTVVLPAQGIASLDGNDTIEIDPGNGVEIDFIKMKTGSLSYSISEDISLKASLTLTLPTGFRNIDQVEPDTIKETITVIPGITNNGTIVLDNASLDLGTIAGHPYNMIPVKYTVNVSSDNKKITFDSNDEVNISIELLDPEFDYVKGYFGQETESIDTDSLDLEIKEILDHITGDFLISNPSIKLNYSNSFAIPIKVDLQATGIRGSEEIDLGLPPVFMRYPAAPEEHNKDTFFIINRNNSKLPELISLPPEKVRFSGSAVMNPDGNTGTRDNYLFGDSRFTGSLEVEVPLEFRLNNLQFSDTIDNFMKNDDQDSDSPFNPEDIEYLKIIFSAENGFPIGISLSMSLYDSTSNTIKSSIDANDILKPALIDDNGKVTEPTDSEISLKITREFWNSINISDKIIFTFSVNTTGSDLFKDVKIYSDYSINFNAALVLKPNINL